MSVLNWHQRVRINVGLKSTLKIIFLETDIKSTLKEKFIFILIEVIG